MKTFKEVLEEVSPKRPKATHTVHLQKIQYGYWGETPYDDKIRKVKVHADSEDTAKDQATHNHPSNSKQMYKSLLNGDKTTLRVIKVEKH